MTYSITKTFNNEQEYLEHQKTEQYHAINSCVLERLSIVLRNKIKHNTRNATIENMLFTGASSDHIDYVFMELQNMISVEKLAYMQDSFEIS